jgi:hypothetical protein
MIVGRKSDFWDWKEEISTGERERENWVDGKNNKQRKLLVYLLLLKRKNNNKKLNGVGFTT